MCKELTALNENETWDLVPLPAGKKPIGFNACIELRGRHMVHWIGVNQDMLQKAQHHAFDTFCSFF